MSTQGIAAVRLKQRSILEITWYEAWQRRPSKTQ